MIWVWIDLFLNQIVPIFVNWTTQKGLHQILHCFAKIIRVEFGAYTSYTFINSVNIKILI